MTATTNPPQATLAPSPMADSPAGPGLPARAKHPAEPEVFPPGQAAGRGMADPFLSLAAESLLDLERIRIGDENRLRQMTRSEPDSDGEMRGFGLMPPGVCPPDDKDRVKKLAAFARDAALDAAVTGKRLRPPRGWHPAVWSLALRVSALQEAEDSAVADVERAVRTGPFGPWAAAQRGVGAKQLGRLLAVIGDPYIRPQIMRADGTADPSRPRLVSELWALCGYHVLEVPAGGPHGCDAHSTPAAGGTGSSHPCQCNHGTQGATAGVAARPQRGKVSNWNPSAKMRAWLIAESCVKQPAGSRYRDVYDAARRRYAEAVHQAPCIRCGPSGKPAQPGSPLSDGHKHGRALRAIAKELLKDLWLEARRLHTGAAASGQDYGAAHTFPAAGGSVPARSQLQSAAHERDAAGIRSPVTGHRDGADPHPAPAGNGQVTPASHNHCGNHGEAAGGGQGPGGAPASRNHTGDQDEDADGSAVLLDDLFGGT